MKYQKSINPVLKLNLKCCKCSSFATSFVRAKAYCQKCNPNKPTRKGVKKQ